MKEKKLVTSNSFSERLNNACQNAGIPVRGRAKFIQDRLSEKVSLVGIRKWLIGEAMPEIKRIGELAEIAHTSTDVLLGESDEPGKKELSQIDKSRIQLRPYEVPILQWHDIEKYLDSGLPDSFDAIHCPNRSVSNLCFALRVVGDSMASPIGKSYPEGAIIFVDPGKSAKSGMRVIAKTSKGYTFKQLVQNEFGQNYLKSLNSSYQLITEEGIEVCGVVVGCYIEE